MKTHGIQLKLREFIKRSKQNKNVRQAAVFSFFSFLNNGIKYLLLIIVAGAISPAGYGSLNLFTICVTLFGYLICLNTNGIIPVTFFRESQTEVRRNINAVFSLSLICFIALSAAVCLWGDTIEKATSISKTFQWIALWVCFFQVFTTVNLDIWRLEENPISYGVYSLGLVLLNSSLMLALVFGWHWDWQGAVYAQAIAGGVFFIISLVFLVRRGYLTRIRPLVRNFKEALSFGVPLIPHSLSFWLRQGLDRVFINSFHNVAVVGLFSFSLNFAGVIQMLGTAFNAANSVFIYKNLAKDPENARKVLRKQTQWMTLFFVLLTVTVCLGASVFIPFFFPEYKGAVVFLFFQCLGAMFNCLYLLFVNYLFYYKKTKILMYITFSISVLHALLSYALTRYSVLYTVAIGALTNFLIMAGVFLYSRRVYKVI